VRTLPSTQTERSPRTDVRDRAGARRPRATFTPRYNIAPTQRAPIVRALPDGTRTLALLQLGSHSALDPGQTDERTARKDAARRAQRPRRDRAVATNRAFREAVRAAPLSGARHRVSTSGVRRPASRASSSPSTSRRPRKGCSSPSAACGRRWQPPASPEAMTPALDHLHHPDLRGQRRIMVRPPRPHAGAHSCPSRTGRSGSTRGRRRPFGPARARSSSPPRPARCTRAPAHPRVNAVRNEGPDLLTPPRTLLL
jgi:hypothetical protein